VFTTAPALINLAVPPGTTLYQLAPSLNQEVLPRGPSHALRFGRGDHLSVESIFQTGELIGSRDI